MKTVLCFGDSNVFGFVPSKGTRYSSNDRWSGILKEQLKEFYDVVEAGMNGRTCFSDCFEFEKVGIKAIEKYLDLKPDIILLAIGLNDLQSQYCMTEEKFEKGLKDFVGVVKNNCPLARIILLSPSRMSNALLNTFFSCLFDEISIKLSEKLSDIYQKVAQELSCDFIDLDKIAETSSKDGLHYEPDMHKRIAHVLANYLE